MDHAPDGSALPTTDDLRTTLAEHAELLQGPSLPDPLEARVSRIVTSTSDLLDRSEAEGEEGSDADESVRRAVARAIAWTAESVGAFQRLPGGFAFTRSGTGEVSPALALIDELDLLGLTLDHTYDAAYRGDAQALAKQLAVLDERFATDTEPTELVEDARITEDDLDQEHVEEAGLEVGDDGIPRMPIPEPPSPTTPDAEPEEASS